MTASTPLFGLPRPEPVPAPREPVDLEPASAYEAVTRQMVIDLADDVREIKSRTNTIFYVVIGSIVFEMLSRWLGG